MLRNTFRFFKEEIVISAGLGMLFMGVCAVGRRYYNDYEYAINDYKLPIEKKYGQDKS
jgi:hypothetical protein